MGRLNSGVRPLSNDLAFDHASYSIHVLTSREPPDAITGFGRVSCKSIGDNVFASEWAHSGGSLTHARESLASAGILMRHLRVYKPVKERWCTVDSAVLQDALANGFIVQA